MHAMKHMQLRFICFLAVVAAPPHPTLFAYDDADDLLKKYVFIGDFSEQPMRWEKKYPHFMKPPNELSTIDLRYIPFPEISHVKGSGYEVQLFNRAVSLFNNKSYDDVAKLLNPYLSGRDRGAFVWRMNLVLGMAFFNKGVEGVEDTSVYSKEIEGERHGAIMYGLSFIYVSLKENATHSFAMRAYYNLIVGIFSEGHLGMVYGIVSKFLKFFKHSEYHFLVKLLKGELLIHNKDFRQAVETFDEAIRFDSKRYNVHMAFYRVGETYLVLNNYLLANEVFEMALLLDPLYAKSRPSLLWAIAEAKFWIGKNKESRKYYQILVDDHIHTAYGRLAILRLGDAWLDDGKVVKSTHHYQRSAHLHGDLITGKVANLMLAYIQFLQRKSLANLKMIDEKLLERYREQLLLVRQDPLSDALMQEISAYFFLLTYIRKDVVDEKLIALIRQFIVDFPESQFNRSFRGYFVTLFRRYFTPYYQKKQYGKAVSFYEKNREALFEGYQDANFRFKLALSYRSLKMYKQSSEQLAHVFKKVKEKNARKALFDAHYLSMADVFIHNRDQERARAYIIKAARYASLEKSPRLNVDVLKQILLIEPLSKGLWRAVEGYLDIFSVNATSRPFWQQVYQKTVLNGDESRIVRLSTKIINFEEVFGRGDVLAAYRFKLSALESLARWFKAYQLYLRMNEKFPETANDASVLYAMARIARLIGKNEAHRSHLQAIVDLKEKSVYTHYARVQLKAL